MRATSAQHAGRSENAPRSSIQAERSSDATRLGNARTECLRPEVEIANGARRADLGEACATGAPAEHAGEAIHVEVVRPLEPGDRSVDEVLTPAGKVELRHARHDGQILPFLYRPV